MGGVEYQVTKVDPTDPETKGMVYQVHKVSEEIAATLGGKVYRARIINNPTDPTVAGKVYQIVLIGDPSDPAVKGKVYNAILTGGSEAVVIGPAVSPLVLPDAVAGELNYVKAYGGTELSGTPTPSTPATITCNNGILKVKDSELPVGYKRLKNIKTTGDVRYVSNVYLTGSDTLRFTFQAASGNLLGSYNDSSANDNYSFYNTVNATGSYARYNGQTGGSGTYTGTIYNVTMSPTGITGVRNPSSFTPREFTCSIPFCIFATSPTGSGHSNATIIGNIEVSGSQTLKFIPCERVSDGAIGYWETSNQEFLEKQGSGTPTTDGYDTSYMTEVYADGTVETIKDSLNNTATTEMLLSVGDYTDEQEIISGAVTRNVGVKVLDGTERFTVRQTQSGIATMSLSDCPRYAGSSEIEFIVSHFIFQQLVDGGSKTSGKPIGFYAYYSDTQPSTRNWYFNVDATLYPTADDFKQFLAAQYNAGTPVIIVYPLATPTTEVVAGQTLQVQAGDNTLEITQASMSDLELEAQYEQGVQASVEEIEP